MLDTKRQALRRSGNRLAIPGRWSCRDLARDILLGKSAGADGALTVRNFFKFLSPELRYVPSRMIEIGAIAFVAHELVDPGQVCAVGRSMPVTEDSILLDDQPLDDPSAPAWHHQVQMKGGKLVAGL